MRAAGVLPTAIEGEASTQNTWEMDDLLAFNALLWIEWNARAQNTCSLIVAQAHGMRRRARLHLSHAGAH